MNGFTYDDPYTETGTFSAKVERVLSRSSRRNGTIGRVRVRILDEFHGLIDEQWFNKLSTASAFLELWGIGDADVVRDSNAPLNL